MEDRYLRISYEHEQGIFTARVHDRDLPPVLVTGGYHGEPGDLRDIALAAWLTLKYQTRLMAFNDKEHLYLMTCDPADEVKAMWTGEPCVVGTWYPGGAPQNPEPHVEISGNIGFDTLVGVAAAIGLTITVAETGEDEIEFEDGCIKIAGEWFDHTYINKVGRTSDVFLISDKVGQ